MASANLWLAPSPPLRMFSLRKHQTDSPKEPNFTTKKIPLREKRLEYILTEERKCSGEMLCERKAEKDRKGSEFNAKNDGQK